MQLARLQSASATEGFWERVALQGLEPLFVLSESGLCLVVSDAAVTETGYSRNELVRRPFWELAQESDVSTVKRRLQMLEQTGSDEFGIRIRTAQDELQDVRVLARRDRLNGDNVTVVTLQRTTIARSAENLLRRKSVLENVIDRVQQRAAHATPDDVPELIGWVLGEASIFLGADRGYLLAYDADLSHETMTHEWVAPGVEPEMDSFVNVPLALAPASSQRHFDLEVCSIRDVSTLSGDWAADRRFYEASGLKSILELPIVVDGRPIGGLGFDWLTRCGDWADADLILLSVIASTIGQLLGREAIQQEMHRRSAHDDLTGLFNRSGLLGEIERARFVGGGTNVGSIMVIDIDGFTALNDSLGRSVGDLLIRNVAARLRGLVRPNDAVARIGADEFAVAMGDLDDDWVAGQAARRIAESLAEPYSLNGRQHMITVSCGVTSFGEEIVDAEELIRQASTAMYHARESEQANVATFDPGYEREVSQRFELEQRLRVALERDEFEVHFQPEVDLVTGHVVGAEALLRWRCDGMLQDAYTFVPVTEQTGLIIPIGRWVLTEAVRHAYRWREWLGDSEFVVRVNVSPRQFEDPTFIDHVESTLRRVGLDPHCLCLEITETALMHDAKAAIAILEQLDALGIQLAIDDFGTGYSSLAYLKQFPVDILKIDRSFVINVAEDPQDRAIVRTVINLAQSLGMDVTAEGIETPEQQRVLAELGCPTGQGWLFSKAIEPAELDEMIWNTLTLSER